VRKLSNTVQLPILSNLGNFSASTIADVQLHNFQFNNKNV